jgi:YndJ-like protein
VGNFGAVDAVFGLGLLTAVPLALDHVAFKARKIWSIGLVSGVAAVVARSSTLNVNALAVGAALFWLAISVALAASPVLAWFSIGGRGFNRSALRQRAALVALLRPAAFVFLIVGAAWLALAALRREILGFPEQIVLLTGVHFHFAGFATAVVAMVRIDTARSAKELRWARSGGWLAIAGPACVAIGHLTVGFMELVGAFVMAAAVACLSIAAFMQSRWREGVPRSVLRAAALVPLVTMSLALHYALNRVVNVHPLSYANIASIHGVLNVGVFLSGNLMVGGARTLVVAVDPKNVGTGEVCP